MTELPKPDPHKIAAQLLAASQDCHTLTQSHRAEGNIGALAGALRGAIAINEGHKDIMAPPGELLHLIRATLKQGGLRTAAQIPNRRLDGLITETAKKRDVSALAAAIETILTLCEQAVAAVLHEDVTEFPMASDLVRNVRDALHDPIL